MLGDWSKSSRGRWRNYVFEGAFISIGARLAVKDVITHPVGNFAMWVANELSAGWSSLLRFPFWFRIFLLQSVSIGF